MNKSSLLSRLNLSQIALALGGVLAATVVYAQSASAPSGTTVPEQPMTQNAPYPCEMGGWGWHRGGYGGHWGGRGMHRGGYGGAYFGGYMMDSLQLTTAQQDTLRILSQKTQEQALTLRNQLSNVHVQLGDALAQPNLDKAAIAKLQAQQTDLREKLAALHDNAQVKAMEVLTSEQRTQMNQNMQNYRMGSGTPPCMGGNNGNYPRRGWHHRGGY